MANEFNFVITANASVSNAFIEKSIKDFASAAQYIKQLPYKRNSNKKDLLTVFSDGYGTCSTKHALLYQLAVENQYPVVKLILGIFKMNSSNTPKIATTLQTSGLTYIPEAHNYLKVDNVILDCTNARSSAGDFVDDLISEIEIEPHQITDFKVAYHKDVLSQWIADSGINKTLDEVWGIREQCIADLSA